MVTLKNFIQTQTFCDHSLRLFCHTVEFHPHAHSKHGDHSLPRFARSHLRNLSTDSKHLAHIVNVAMVTLYDDHTFEYHPQTKDDYPSLRLYFYTCVE